MNGARVWSRCPDSSRIVGKKNGVAGSWMCGLPAPRRPVVAVVAIVSELPPAIRRPILSIFAQPGAKHQSQPAQSETRILCGMHYRPAPDCSEFMEVTELPATPARNTG